LSHLFDTQILIWAAAGARSLPPRAAELLDSDAADRCFSVVSLWEIVVKRALRKPDFQVDPVRMRSVLLTSGLREIGITSGHAFAVGDLPPIHRDPFDRMLVAQARLEGLILVTADRTLATYPASILKV